MTGTRTGVEPGAGSLHISMKLVTQVRRSLAESDEVKPTKRGQFVGVWVSISFTSERATR